LRAFAHRGKVLNEGKVLTVTEALFPGASDDKLIVKWNLNFPGSTTKAPEQKST
jgi:hypothetical protein